MKKIIKRVLLVVLLVAIAFYLYKLGLMLYVYNKIDKNMMKNFTDNYSVKMIYDNGRTIQNWYSKDYAKTTFSVQENKSFSSLWYDFSKKQKITKADENRLLVEYYTDEKEIALFPLNFFNSDSNFASGYSIQYLKEVWSNVKEWGILNALYSTVVVPVISVDSLKTEEIDGKEYFVVTSKQMQLQKYIDKDTYLPFKYVHTDGNFNDVQYEFSFEPITKESLEFPNFDEYYVTMN